MGGVGSGNNVDWQFEMACYNEQNGTEYQNIDDLLKEVYNNLKSLMRVEKSLGGPSWVSIRNKLVKAGVQMQSRGGPNNKGMKLPGQRRVVGYKGD